jgi:hypothetical protein
LGRLSFGHAAAQTAGRETAYPEGTEARERALKEAKAAAKNGAKVGPLKKKKK